MKRPILIGVLALLLCSACQRTEPVAAKPDATPVREVLRLGIDQWPGYYPAALADELGYFGEQGLTLDIQLPGNTDRMLSEFAAGQYDLIGVALGDLITLSRNRPDVVVALVSDESAGGDALLMRADYTIAASGAIRIGTNLGGFGELFVRELLPRLQIDPARVEWVNADASNVPQLLQAGELELGHCWEPYASQAVELGATRLLSSADTPGLIPDVIASTRHLSGERGDALRAFQRGWFRAVDYWRANPEHAASLIEQRLKLPAGSASLSGISLQDLVANRRLLAGEQPELLPLIQRYSEFFVARGRLLEPADGKTMLVPELLP